jgi:hypothetical protein
MSARRLAIGCALSLMLLAATSAQACGICDWFGGRSTAAPATVAPTFVPTAVVPGECAAPAAQTTYYAPPIAVATPVTTYRPFLPIVPRPTTTYYRPSGYNPFSAAPVTVFRPIVPVQPVVTTTRLIPYTSYRMEYPTAVTYGFAPACAAPPVCSPPPVYQVAPPACAVPQGGMAAPSYEQTPMAAPSEGDASQAPSLPPGSPSTTYYPPEYSPAPVVVEKPYYTPPAETRQENKPVTPDQPKAAPQDEKKSGTDDNSTKSANPSALQRDSILNPRDGGADRTTMRPVRQVSRQTVAARPLEIRVLSADAWREAKD